MSSEDTVPPDESQSDSHSETIRDRSLNSGELIPPHVADHELIRIIGSGGYGDVWLARNVMGVYRAVKVIYRARFNSDRPYEREFAGIERFEPISRSHESQVNILHVGRGDNCFYYVMELADPTEPVSTSDAAFAGSKEIVSSTDTSSRKTRIVPVNPDVYEPRTLRSEFKTKGRLPFDECLEISLALTKALDHLHANRLVHRDIKPANIIFVGGRPKLADIGLVAETDATISYVGTEGYIPPEGPGRPQADVYSLGKTIYEISTGRDRNDFPELPTLLKEETERTGLVELNEVVLRACEERTQDRYASALAMHEDLVQIQAGKSVRRMHHLERQLRFLRRAAAAAIVLVVILGTIFHFWNQAKASRREALTVASTMSQVSAEDYFSENRLIESLPWLIQAMELSRHDRSTVERLENIFSSVVEYSPKPVWDLAEGGGWTWFTPEGSHLLINRNHVTSVYDFESRQEVRQLIHSNKVQAISFSTTTNWLVTGEAGKNELNVWDWQTGERLFELAGHRYHSNKRFFFPDGKRLISRTATGNRDTGAEVIVFNLETREVERQWDLNATEGNMALHPEGSMFAVTLGRPGTGSSAKWLRVYDVNSGILVTNIAAADRPGPVQFSPDGKWLAFGPDIRILSTETWEDVSPRDILTPSWIVRFSPDSTRIALADSSGNQQLLSLHGTNWVESSRRAVNSAWIQSFGFNFSPDGRLLSSDDPTARRVQLVDADTFSLSEAVSMMPTQNELGQATFHPTQPILLARESYGAKIRFWDFGHALSLPTESFPPATNRVVKWNQKSDRLLLGRATGKFTVRPRESANATPLFSTNLSFQIRSGHFGLLGRSAFVAGQLNATNASPQAVLWSEERGVSRLELQTTNPIAIAEFTDDGSLCAIVFTNSESEIAVHAVDTGERVFRATLPFQINVHHLAWGSQNEWLVLGASTGSLPNLLLGWDLNSGQENFRMNRRMAVTELYRSPDHNIVVVEGGLVSIHDPVSGGTLSSRLIVKSGDGALSTDGMLLAHLGTDNRLRVLSTTDLSPVGSQIRLGTSAGLVAWSPDDTKLVTSHSQYIRIWDAETGQPLTAPLFHGTRVSKWNRPLPSFIGFSPDSEKVFALGWDGGIREWPVVFPSVAREDMKPIATLYSGQRIEDPSVIVPVSAEELAAMHDVAPSRVGD